VACQVVQLSTEPSWFVTDEVLNIENETFWSHASLGVGSVKITLSPQLTVSLSAQVRVGGVLSVTEMVLLQVDELPQSSVAVHVRVTEYSCGQLPGVVTSLDVGTTLLSQASLAEAEPKLGVFGHSTLDTVGQVIHRRCIISYRNGAAAC
jgi:hypothetical protein